ncbi:MAG: response regulator transcription factor [Phycisphaeraceae bacterium]|nr:response regulator transcription factor [Phycisphaeraceae bacterium]
MRVKIVLADDHDAIRQALRSLLETEPDFEIVGEACHGSEAVQLVEQSQPDVVIMDISMPVINGIEATRRLNQSLPDVKVIAFSSHVAKPYVLGMFRAGASGYVVKPSSKAELRTAIRVVLKGQVHISQSLHVDLINEICTMDKEKHSE